jgi:RNA polymerase sigma-70 factor (ECF subfamily)
MDDPAREGMLVVRLRAGDESAFRDVVQGYHGSMVRLAQTFVPSRAVAEEVAQEAWLAVIKGIDRFEGRSSLKTWIYRIVANIARTRGERERRTVASGDLNEELAGQEASVPATRFSGPQGRGAWAAPPARWSELPDERLLAQDTVDRVKEIASGLTANQRRVFLLRDVEGLAATEVCDLLDLSEGNQRVLLHRARSKVRAALEAELGVEA